MTDCREQIEQLCPVLEEIAILAYKEDEQAYKEFTNVYKLTFEIMMDFFNSLEELNKIGVQLEIKVLHQQILNLLQIEKEKNLLFLGDTLKFEIIQALLLYKEIQNEIINNQ